MSYVPCTSQGSNSVQTPELWYECSWELIWTPAWRTSIWSWEGKRFVLDLAVRKGGSCICLQCWSSTVARRLPALNWLGLCLHTGRPSTFARGGACVWQRQMFLAGRLIGHPPDISKGGRQTRRQLLIVRRKFAGVPWAQKSCDLACSPNQLQLVDDSFFTPCVYYALMHNNKIKTVRDH